MTKSRGQIAYDALFPLLRRFLNEDDPELKKMALELRDNVSSEAKALHDESIVIDSCNFFLESYKQNWILQNSGVTAINCTVPGVMDTMGEAVRNIMNYYQTIRNEEKLVLVETAQDILDAKANGQIAVIIGAQSCEFVHHDDLFSSIEVFKRMGLRVMQIAYNQRTFAADGCFSGDDAGITRDGKVLIRAMNQAGIVVDLSHVGRRSSLEAMEYCEKPPIFSHSNPKKLYDHPRNITDEHAKKLADLGGVIGACAYPVISYNGTDFPTLETFLNTISYYADLIGVDHIGIGMDSLSQAGAYERRSPLQILWGPYSNDNFHIRSYEAGRGIKSFFTEGLVNLANFVNITDGLMKRGFSKTEIQKIIGLNYFRVFKEWWE